MMFKNILWIFVLLFVVTKHVDGNALRIVAKKGFNRIAKIPQKLLKIPETLIKIPDKILRHRNSTKIEDIPNADIWNQIDFAALVRDQRPWKYVYDKPVNYTFSNGDTVTFAFEKIYPTAPVISPLEIRCNYTSSIIEIALNDTAFESRGWVRFSTSLYSTWFWFVGKFQWYDITIVDNVKTKTENIEVKYLPGQCIADLNNTAKLSGKSWYNFQALFASRILESMCHHAKPTIPPVATVIKTHIPNRVHYYSKCNCKVLAKAPRMNLPTDGKIGHLTIHKAMHIEWLNLQYTFPGTTRYIIGLSLIYFDFKLKTTKQPIKYKLHNASVTGEFGNRTLKLRYISELPVPPLETRLITEYLYNMLFGNYRTKIRH